MKALTNILNYILLLLMILIASCTEDVAEVDNLVRGEEYVQVRMQVPGMKNATTRADEAEDNLTSVVVLVFRNDALVSKTEVTTASSTLTTTTDTTGTFNIPRPKSGDVIHFLGNLPETVKNSLPATGGTQEEVLCALTTSDDKNLSYWGMATYESGESLSVTLYRNMAKIEIAAGDECTFPKDQLFIVGLVNFNQVGALVPCNEEGTFGYRDEPTLPKSPSPKTDETIRPLATSLYVFEHENPGTANGLYVICKIEDDYYKVALIDEDKEPYPIIRNHRYVIYVNDLDEGADSFYTAALPETKPYNFEVREYKDVTLTLPSSVTLDYTKSNPSASKLSLTVGGIENVVETLTFNAPGFTIQPGDGAAATAENGVFKITNTSKESIGFTFTLTDPDNVESISVTGAGKYVNNEITPASTTVTLNLLKESIEVTPTTSTLYYDSDEPQVVTVNVTVPDGVGTLTIDGASNFTVKQGDELLTATDTEGVYSYTVTDNSNLIPFTFTLDAQNVTSPQTITFSDPSETVNAASVPITMAPTPTVSFTKAGSQTIRLNDTPLSVTMYVPEDKTLSEFSITITPATGLNVAQGENQLTLTEGVYTTTSGVSDEQTFTFTPTVVGTYTITFSGEGTDVNMPDENNRTINLKVEAAAATTLSVTAVDGDSTIDLDSDDTYVTFTLTKPASVQNVELRITNANGDNVNDRFTLSANPSNNVEYNNSIFYIREYNNNTNLSVTFTVKDNSIPGGEYTATFTGNYNGQNITATATITIVNTPTVSFSNTGKQTLYWNGGTKPTTFTVDMTNIPTDGSVTLSIKAADFEVSVPDDDEDKITYSDGTYTYIGGNTTFTFTPTNHGPDKSITITGSGTKVKVPSLEPIIVDVKNENAPSEIVIWEGEETKNNNNGFNIYDQNTTSGPLASKLDYIVKDNTLCITFNYNATNVQVTIKSPWGTPFPSATNPYTYADVGAKTISLKLTDADVSLIKTGGGISIWATEASGITLTKITIKEE